MSAGFAIWAILGALVVAMLLVDLFVFGRGGREVTVRESARGRSCGSLSRSRSGR